jgi:hypothetical protein
MLIDEKTETQKSHATVHLNIRKKQINLESARNMFVFNWQGSLQQAYYFSRNNIS